MEPTHTITTPTHTPAPSWDLSRKGRLLVYFLFACAGLIFTRVYMLNTWSYLDLNSYLAGTERLPYQRRVLPMLLLRGLLRLPYPHTLAHHFVIFANAPLLYLLGINLLAFGLTGWLTTRLYRVSTPQGRFPLLVFPIFLFVSMWTYLMRPLFITNLPYDFLSQAFFTAGLFCLYTDRFMPLLLIVAVGTFNRETTLFLILLYVIDALATRTGPLFARIPWLRTSLLAATWLAIKLFLGRLYTQNNPIDDFLRFRVNAHLLVPDNYPQILTACGFLLPVLWLLRRNVPNPRLAAWLYIVPIWIVMMIPLGVLNESRIFGELCPLVAVLATTLLDAYTHQAHILSEGGLSR